MDILGFDKVDFYFESETFVQQDGIKISYDFYIEGIPFLASASNLLYEQGIVEGMPEDLIIDSDLLCFYNHHDKRSILPFDFAAMSFWLLSRYEEYLSFIPDKHGRYTATESFAFKNNFLDIPIIDFWAIELKNRLSNHYNKTFFPAPKEFSFQATFDIDYAWAYRNKSFWRILAGYFRDLLKFDLNALKERFMVLMDRKKDPYFTFSIIEELHKNYNPPIFFWLVGDYGKFDKNTHYKNKEFRQLIKEICTKNKIGIHPSYASCQKSEQNFIELKRLEEIAHLKITLSRQHYLKLNFPDTYLRLLELGISDDYTMGYAEAPGFRASTSNAYNWYNLKEEKESSLRIHPFMIMDVSLNSYLKLNVEEAFELSKNVIDHCKRAGGQLITIWHNNSFCEKDNWKSWTEFYKELIEYATKK